MHYDSLEAIRGNSGHDSSLNILMSLVKLVKAFPVPPEEGIRLISYISRNVDSICSTQVQIFPPTFPPKYSGMNDIDGALQYWKKELEHLKSQLAMYTPDHNMNYADKSAVVALQKQLQGFADAASTFRESYEKKMQGKLSGKERGEAPLLGLGKQSSIAVGFYDHISQLLKDIESIWSYLQTFQNL